MKLQSKRSNFRDRVSILWVLLIVILNSINFSLSAVVADSVALANGESVCDGGSIFETDGSKVFRAGNQANYRIPLVGFASISQGPVRGHIGRESIDFSVTTGTAVVASRSGIATRHWRDDYGDHVRIQHYTGNSRENQVDYEESVYAHLSNVVISNGQWVEQGDLIGYSGNTSAYKLKPHLHFEVVNTRNGWDYVYIRGLSGFHWFAVEQYDQQEECDLNVSGNYDGYAYGPSAPGVTPYDGMAPECKVENYSGVIIYDADGCESTRFLNTPYDGTVFAGFEQTGFEPKSIYIAPGWSVFIDDGSEGSGEEKNHLCATRSLWDLNLDYYHPVPNRLIAGNVNRIIAYKSENCDGLARDGQLINLSNYPKYKTPGTPGTGGGGFDSAAPTATGYTVSINGGTATLSVSGASDSGGSGLSHANFSAKYGGSWHGVETDSSEPFSVSWNMCEDNVQDGDIEFGLEIHDNAGNIFFWHEHAANPHRSKSFNCSPNQGGSSGSVKLFADTYYSGSVLWSQNTGFTNEPNAEGRSLEIPSGWSVKVWSDDGKRGSEKCFSKSIHNLQDYGWNNKIQSMEAFSSNVCGDANTGYVEVCDNSSCITFRAGYYRLQDIGWENRITKIKAVPSDMSIMLFRARDRKGTVECYNAPRETLPNGGSFDLYQQVSEIVVSNSRNCPVEDLQAIIMHDGRNHEGWAWSAGLGPERLNMKDLGPEKYYDNTLESIMIPEGRSVILHDDENLGGNNSGCLTGSHGEIVSRDNRVSSIEIFDNTNCVPAAPSGLNAAPLTETSVQLWWEHLYASDFRYKVYKWNGSVFEEIEYTTHGATSYIDQNVQCASTYYYKVSAQGSAESVQSGWTQVTTMSCSTPDTPVLDIPGSDRWVDEQLITFSWQPVANATEYVAALVNETQNFQSGVMAATTWSIRNVPPGLYTFGVGAYNSTHSNDATSQWVYVRAQAAELIDAKSTTCDSITLYWKNNSAYAEKFVIHTNAVDDLPEISYQGGEYYTYTFEGLEAGAEYAFIVETTPVGGLYPGISNQLDARVRECQAEDELVLLSPDNNTSFVEGEFIDFKWTPSAQAVEYLLMLVPGQDAGIQKAIYTTDIQLSVADLVPGTYEWLVIAFDDNDFPYHNSVTRIVTVEAASVQVPEWPQNVRTSDATQNSIRLSWDDVANEDGYILWQWQNDAYAEILRVGDGITSFVILNLVCGTEYHFAVSAYNDAGESEQNGSPGTTLKCDEEVPDPSTQIFLPFIAR